MNCLGGTCWGPVSQRDFLCRLGIETRAAKLAQAASARQKVDIDSALHRLIGAEQMGTLFKVLAVGPRGSSPPAGFLPEEAMTT